MPVKSENKKICKEVDENQQLWYDKKKSGELVQQAERKSSTSTHIPDLDNANVGTYKICF